MVDLIKEGGATRAAPVQFVRVHRSRWRSALPWILALLVSVTAHVAMVETLPAHFLVGDDGPPGKGVKRERPIDLAIRLLIPEPEPEEEKEPPEEQFVATNPEVPENKPDETYQYSNRDQQSAQEEKPEELDPDKNPAMEGLLEDASGIVKPRPGTIATAQAAPANQSAQQAMQAMQQQEKREATQDTEFDDPLELSPPALPDIHEGEERDGKGVANIIKSGEAEEMPDRETEETVLADVITPEALRRMQTRRQQQQQGVRQVAPQDEQMPRPQPKLTGMQTAPLALRDSNRGVSRTGQLAINSRFSEYGDYQARLLETIGMKWNDLNSYSRVGVADTRSEVTIKFFVTKEGYIEDLEILDSNATMKAEWNCKDAIQHGAPYWPWTADMVRILGDRQPVTVRFLYW